MGAEWVKQQNTGVNSKRLTDKQKETISHYKKMKKREDSYSTIIRLQASIMVYLSSDFIGENINYELSILLDDKPSSHFDHMLIWDERIDSEEYKSKRLFRFNYKISRDTKILCRITTKNITYEGVFVWNDLLMLKGGYGHPIPKSNFDNNPDSQQALEGAIDLDQVEEQIVVKMAIEEDKPINSKRLRFWCTANFQTPYPLILSFYEVIGNSTKLIYQTKAADREYKNEIPSFHYFDPIVFNADILENDILTTKKIEVTAIELRKTK